MIACRLWLCALVLGGLLLQAKCLAAVDEPSPAVLPPTDAVGWNRAFFVGIPHDAVAVAAAPRHWDTNDWWVAGGLLATGALLYAADPRIARWAQSHRNSTTDHVANAIEPFGREYVAAGLVVAGGLSLVTKDPRLTRTALLGGESLLFVAIIDAGAGALSHRSRPEDGAGHAQWDGPGGHGDSFPSGHAAAAFAVATIVADEWSDTPGVTPTAYAMATLVSLSRIHDDKHWASDVFIGALLGWAVGSGVEHLHSAHHQRRITILPILDRNNQGVAMMWRW